MRKIRITGKGLPRFQQKPGTFIGPLAEDETYDPFPKINLSQFIGCPPGQKVDSATGNCIPDPKFKESSVERPRSTDGYRNPLQDEADRFSAVVGTRTVDGQNVTTSGDDLMKMWTKNYIPALATKIYDPTLAIVALSGVSKTADVLQQADLENRLNKFQRQVGRTDNRFAPVPNIYSRGRTDTGYAYNMMTPVQFAGVPTSEAMISPQFPQAPRFQFGQDGIEVRRDILQMPELYTQIQPLQTYPDIDLSAATPTYSEAPTMPTAAPTVSAVPLSSTMVMENLSLPLDPYEFRVGSGFGKRRAPKAGASVDHTGIDLGASSGSNIYSIKPGRVLSTYFNSKGGNQVIIAHNDGTRSGYAHLKDFAVKQGDIVGAGDIIGYVGSTGISTGPHLHFTYRDEKGDLVDPFTLIDWNQYGISAKRSKTFKKKDTYKEGGEYDLDEDEIKQILANGGQVEFL
jgi:murein DD-endopeptidase MepM/ murein hydrolase activator NlpD